MSRSKTVLADGCFDPLHIGHVRYLRAAGELGDHLVVNIAPDDMIRAKGRTPFQTEAERREVIQALWGVSSTTHGDLANVVRSLKPDLLVKGPEWEGKLPPDVLAACLEVGARIVYTDTRERSSTERLND